MKRRIKINGIIIIIAVICILCFPRLFFRDVRPGFAGEFLRIFGFALLCLGQLLRVSARGYKAEHSQGSRTLVCGGPYAAVRNPMYLGILLIGSGIILILFRWQAAVIFLIVFAARYLVLVLREEEKLRAAFPAEYGEYLLKVPRLFPSPKTLRRPISEFLPFKFSWLSKEAASIIAVIAVTLGIELWQRALTGRLREYPVELAATIALLGLFIALAVYLNKNTYGYKNEVTIKSETSA